MPLSWRLALWELHLNHVNSLIFRDLTVSVGMVRFTQERVKEAVWCGIIKPKVRSVQFQIFKNASFLLFNISMTLNKLNSLGFISFIFIFRMRSLYYITLNVTFNLKIRSRVKRWRLYSWGGWSSHPRLFSTTWRAEAVSIYSTLRTPCQRLKALIENTV